ncbi:hypothetical protein SDRG_09064 [Saprolegnia diclina VS20]|uniref:Uncharacterized protein n=1 Tax=Saprolegnia diclina (strain VS20) TaxID=1156394 RepID=T0RML2_SAPDV|nr:hypothetical protein SDRG_09064 [Saprolegnia diclina VS20]EQC33558.1 hypothetical protein SDRG_09064 [Saprolegnia diclina VS20]|eukprot:XP_008613198.1 hypothetical protein SDRG_09064 [Saprolegnia diclina VS20]
MAPSTEVNFSLGFKSPCFFTMLNLAGYQIPLLERSVLEWCERIVAVLNKERFEGTLDGIVHSQLEAKTRPLFAVKMVSGFANDGTSSPRIMLGSEQGAAVTLAHEIAVALVDAIMIAEAPISAKDLATTKRHVAQLQKRIAKAAPGDQVYAIIVDRKYHETRPKRHPPT